ncbi:glycoside hydrolase family 65 protein, partial [Streptomyces sp. SID12501]|nr:glycoside hydrolase family 65 protein [Streptomyces sp. SID12501]
GVDRYSGLDGHHLTDHRTGFAPHGLAWIACRTTSSRIDIALAARTVTRPGAPVVTNRTPAGTVQTFRLPVAPRRSVTVVKTAALYTSLDRPAGDLVERAMEHASRAPGFPALLTTQHSAWERLWEEGEISV